MNCDTCSELIARHVSGELTIGEEASMHEHLSACPRCAAELTEIRAVWTELGTISPALPGPGGLRRLTASLSGGQPPIRRRRHWRSASVAASILVAAVCGFLLGRVPESPAVMTGDAQPAFLLLLWEPATSMSDQSGMDLADLIEEYSTWGDRIAERDQLISAEKLVDESVVWLKGRSDELSEPDHMGWPVLGGYYAVRAADRAAAVDLARSSPHLTYGGAIEIRSVDEIPRP